MKPEDKQLLIRDLCSRLPYGTKIECNGDTQPYTLLSINWNKELVVIGFEIDGMYATSKQKLADIKPYLRKMSSMSKDEKEELVDFGLAYWDNGKHTDENGNTIIYGGKEIQLIPDIETYDWLNGHHFDYRGLIEKGLALEAPKDLYV